MSQSPNKLSIHVKLKPIPPVSEPPKEEIAIRWGRLFGAIGLVGGLVGAAFWFFSLPPTATRPPPQTAQLEALPPVMTAPATPSVSATVTPSPAPKRLQAEKALGADVDLASIQLNPAESLPEPTEIAPEEQTLPEEAPAEAPVHILSDHITHAQLSRGIRARQPTDVAPAVIDMGEETLITVYLFTELTKLRGKTLHYDWYLEGKRKARVVVRPQLEAMTAYSSKYIDPFMRGKWLVKVQTATGEPLARGEFEVR